MRLTELLSTNNGIASKSKYEKLRQRGAKVLMCSSDGWDFDKESNTPEDEAKKWIRENRLISTYEKEHGVDETPSLLVMKIIESSSEINSPYPEWPDELKPYQGKATNILEAYFCDKFGIPCE